MRFTFPGSLKKGYLIEERFSIVKKLGKGGCGQVFKVTDMQNGNEVAAKIEPIYKCNTLKNELRMYNLLWKDGFPIGIPYPISYCENREIVAMAMPIFGQSLRDVWLQDGGLSGQSIGHIGYQMMNRLEYIHRRGIVHLDIKPENMMLGRGTNSRTVYLIDFGLAKHYRDARGEHKPYNEDTLFCGTQAFASRYRDNLEQYSPRDDLESLMYSLAMLYNGRLPWCTGDWDCNSKYSNSVEEDKVKYRESVCDGMPDPIIEAWNIVSTMGYGETPQYYKLRDLFLEAADDCTENDGRKLNWE